MQRKIRKGKDLTGRRYGKLLCLSPAGFKGQQRLWRCKCDCGKEHVAMSSNLIRGSTQSCGCLNGKGQNSLNWKGHGEISGHYWSGLKSSAEHRGIPFNLNIEEAWNQFDVQKRRCALTGLPLEMPDKWAKRSDQTSSLDRIDSSQGYTTDNIQWVHKTVNRMKGSLSDSEFIDWCRKVANHERKEYEDQG